MTQKSDDDASTSAALSSKTARSCGPAIQEDANQQKTTPWTTVSNARQAVLSRKLLNAY